MCGRYPEPWDYKNIEKFFDVLEDLYPGFRARYNIAPTQQAPVIRRGEHGRQLVAMRWGLIPRWAKEASIGSRMINARAESVLEKPAYRRPFLSQRCLVPAGGFYEWQKVGSAKQPYLFRRRDHGPIAFAGLWDSWRDPHSGKALETFTIITTAANELVRSVHDRMPLILSPASFDVWLAPGEPADELLQVSVTAELEAVPVSSWVNSPAHDDARCMEPLVNTIPT